MAYLNLSLLSAGVATSGGVGVGSGPSVGGQRPRNNNFTIEGVDNNNKGVTGPWFRSRMMRLRNFRCCKTNFRQNLDTPQAGSSIRWSRVAQTNSMAHVHLLAKPEFQRGRHFLEDQGITSNPRFATTASGAIWRAIVKNKLFFFGALQYNPVGQASVRLRHSARQRHQAIRTLQI